MNHRPQRPPARRPLRRTMPALALAALLGGGLVACGDEDPTDSAGTSTETSTEPSAEPSAEPSTSDATAASDPTSTATSSAPPASDDAEAAAGFVTPFFVGDTPQGARLFRELHETDPADALRLLADGPADPDYASLVPAGSLTGDYTFDDTGAGTYEVEVAGPGSWSRAPGDMSPAQIRLAVQQIAWTLQTLQTEEAGEDYDPTVRTRAEVEFVRDGEPVAYLGVTGPVTTRAPLRTLGLVNVISGLDDVPAGGTLVVGGMASSFEATVPWTLTDADGTVIEESSSMADGWFGRLYPFTAEVDISALPPGDYVFTATTDDPSGGEGFGPTEDSKVFTID